MVSYEARDLLPDTLEPLHAAHQTGALDCIVVDNASRDGTVEYLRQEHAWARLIASRTNLGFARACNAALPHVSTPFVLLLNPDARIDLGNLSKLVDFLQHHPAAGGAAPAIQNGRGGLQFTQPLPTPLGLLASAFGLRRKVAVPIEPGCPPFRVEWLCGAVLLLRRTLLDELGGFDPRFFLYFEETDLCRRAIKRGAELWAVGESVAHHRVGAVAHRTGEALFHGCIASHYFESRFYYLVKHFGWLRAVIAEAGELAAMALRALLAPVRRKEDTDFSARIRAPIFALPRRTTGAGL